MDFSTESTAAGTFVGLALDAKGEVEVATLSWRGRGFSLRSASSTSGRAALFTETPQARLEIRLPAGAWTLVFVRHDWSGVVLVRDASRYFVHDLYCATDQIGKEEVSVQSHGPDWPIVLELAPQHHADTRAAQIWLLEVKQLPARFFPERGAPVSKVCRLIDGRHGHFLALRTDTGVADHLAATGEWEQGQVELFQRLVRPGETALDVGANIGHHTVALSHLVGDAGAVVAFEPQMQMFNLLNANLVLNRCRNVQPFRVAVGSEATKLRMNPISYEDFMPFGSLGLQDGAHSDVRGELVDSVRLDDFLPGLELGDRPLSFIKVDVQSFELYVFQGALETMRRARPSISFEVSPYWMQQRGYDWRDILRLLEELGYKFFDEARRPLEIPHWDGKSDFEWQFLAVHARYLDRIA